MYMYVHVYEFYVPTCACTYMINRYSEENPAISMGLHYRQSRLHHQEVNTSSLESVYIYVGCFWATID